MKKKGFLFLAILAMSAFVLTTKAQVHLGVKGGINTHRVSFNNLGDNFSSNNRTGYFIGPMLEFMIPVTGIGLDLSLLYSRKAVGFEANNGLTNVNTDYLDIPLHLKTKIGLPILKILLFAGPYASFRLGGSNKWDALTAQFEQKSFSGGIDLGTGVELFKKLQLSLQYSIGLTNDFSAKTLDTDVIKNGKNKGWALSAAFLF